MKLIAEFEINGLPKTVNSIGRKHWAIKYKEAQRWKVLVLSECNRLKISGKEFENVQLVFTRFSTQEPDFDNLASSFKHVLDGLVFASVITDDKPSVIGSPVFRWTKVRQKQGKISVQIFQREEPDLSSENSDNQMEKD